MKTPKNNKRKINTKLRTAFLMLMVTIFSISGMVTASAASINDNGEYALVLSTPDDEWDGCFDGEYSQIIRFNVADGETTVKLSELTQGITPFNGKNEFSHWVIRSNGEKVGEELAIADFTSNGNFYTSTGKEVTYDKGLVLVAKFEGKALNESGNYYVSLDAFGGTIDGKAKVVSISKSTEFKTIDLTNYVPVREGYTFKGWDLDGKIVTSVDSSAFAKDAVVNLTATYTKNTFDGQDRVLVLNANGGTVDGKAIGKYDYLGGGNSGTSMSLLPYIPVREGYTFTGWNSKSDGSGQNYKYIYWRLWDNDGTTDVEKDTLIKNENGAEYYQNVTLYATWAVDSNSSNTVKEIQSNGKTKGTIEFADGINKDYKIEFKEVEVKKELADKNVKFIADINVLDGENVVKISDTKMRIKIALPDDLKGYSKYEIVYILNDEIQETIPATVEDGYIVFETSHLSQYGIVATNTGSTGPNTSDSGLALLLAALFIGGGAVACTTVVSKKKKNHSI